MCVCPPAPFFQFGNLFLSATQSPGPRRATKKNAPETMRQEHAKISHLPESLKIKVSYHVQVVTFGCIKCFMERKQQLLEEEHNAFQDVLTCNSLYYISTHPSAHFVFGGDGCPKRVEEGKLDQQEEGRDLLVFQLLLRLETAAWAKKTETEAVLVFTRPENSLRPW